MASVRNSAFLRYALRAFIVILPCSLLALAWINADLATEDRKNVETQPRPSGFPVRSVRIPGPAEGIWLWVSCENSPEDEAEGGAYQCTLYRESSGTMEVKGLFLTRRIAWDADEQSPAMTPATPLRGKLDYVHYDGHIIWLQGQLALVPHGRVDYPFGNGHGMRQDYHYGEPQGEQIKY